MPARAIAAVAFPAVGLSAGYYGRGWFSRIPQALEAQKSPALKDPAAALNQHIAEPSAANSTLQKEIDSLAAELRRTQSEFRANEADLHLAKQATPTALTGFASRDASTG